MIIISVIPSQNTSDVRIFAKDKDGKETIYNYNATKQLMSDPVREFEWLAVTDLYNVNDAIKYVMEL